MPDQPLFESLRFFGRRKGKPLRRHARNLIETLLPALSIAEPQPGQKLDPRTLFAAPVHALWLEVGFGGGEHLAWQAAHHPDRGMIGGEVFLNGIASLLSHVQRDGLTNVRIFAEDIRRFLPALPDHCLERVFVLFPDPWPKKRHAARRFIGPANLDQFSRLLIDGGELRVASDDPTYQEWTLEQMAARGDFEEVSVDRHTKPEDWPASRYELKAREAGREPLFLRYRKVATPPRPAP